MAEGKLKIDIRRKKILEILKRDGKVFVSELCKTLGVTPVTIRTDLDTLESDGYVERISGGAVYLGDGASLRTDIPKLHEKEEIAEKVVAMIKDGDTVFINSGTTTEVVASALMVRHGLNIVTNSLAAAAALRGASSFRIIMLGGELNAQYGFTYGADAEEKLGSIHADWAILSVDGVSADSGITTYHAEEAAINRIMIERSERALITADYTKIGRTGFMKICDTRADIAIVTNTDSDTAELSRLSECGVLVIK